MWNRIAQILILTLLLCPSAFAQDAGIFTLIPQGGTVPFEATCFDNVATAQLLTWKEFQEQEFQNRLELRLGIQREELTLEIDTLKVHLEESTLRYQESIRLRDEELDSLRGIIKKDRKVNLPLIIAASAAAGIAIGVAGVFVVSQAVD
jgi:hypothetical protein